MCKLPAYNFKAVRFIYLNIINFVNDCKDTKTYVLFIVLTYFSLSITFLNRHLDFIKEQLLSK